MYNEIATEYRPQFEKTDMDFDEQYLIALDYSPHEEVIKQILSAILAEYAKTKGTTRVGRFMRWIAKMFTV